MSGSDSGKDKDTGSGSSSVGGAGVGGSGAGGPSKTPLRKLFPASGYGPHSRPPMVVKATKKQRAKNACVSCQQLKKKCNEQTPKCNSCKDLDIECVYSIEDKARYKRDVTRKKIKEYEHDIGKYNMILEHIKDSNISQLHRVLEVIRGNASLEDIIIFIRNEGTDVLPSEIITPEPTTNDLSLLMNEALQKIEQTKVDSVDLRVVDDRPIIHVPAKPWTNVTDSDELVSHLMSLYWTWDHPIWNTFDFETLIHAMSTGDTNFCSPLLVNTCLAEACHYTNRLEVRADPHNPNYIGHRFLQEALRLWHEESEKEPTLLTVQGALMLGISLSADGMDYLGGMFLGDAVTLIKKVLLDEETGKPKDLPGKGKGGDDYDDEYRKKWEHSRDVTLWSAFNLRGCFDWVAKAPHPMPILDLPLPHPEALEELASTESPNDSEGTVDDESALESHDAPERLPTSKPSKQPDVWRPYPYVRKVEPNLNRLAFREMCTQSLIEYDLTDVQNDWSKGTKQMTMAEKKEFYHRLDEWKEDLPPQLREGRTFAPAPIFFHCHYYAMCIDIHQTDFKNEDEEDKEELEKFKEASTKRLLKCRKLMFKLLDTYHNKITMGMLPQPLTFALLIASRNVMESIATKEAADYLPVSAESPSTATTVTDDNNDKGEEAELVEGEKETPDSEEKSVTHEPFSDRNILDTFETTLKWLCHAANNFVTVKIFARMMELHASEKKIPLNTENQEHLRRLFQWAGAERSKWIQDLEKTQTTLTWSNKGAMDPNVADVAKAMEVLNVKSGEDKPDK